MFSNYQNSPMGLPSANLKQTSAPDQEILVCSAHRPTDHIGSQFHGQSPLGLLFGYSAFMIHVIRKITRIDREQFNRM